MLTTSARLLRLLSVLQSRGAVSGRELAAQLDVTARTVRRDVDRARALGYAITAQPGAGSGYRLEPGPALPPLLLDDEEVVAIALCLQAATATGLAGIEDSALRALATVQQVLPSRLKRRLEVLRSAVVPLSEAHSGLDVDRLLTVARAIRDRESLRADYQDRAGVLTRRLIEPHGVVHAGRRWYLVGWDVDRDDWRTFRLDRLEPRVPNGSRFSRREPPDPDLAAYVGRSITSAPYRHHVRATVHAPADVVAGRFGPTAMTVLPLDDVSCEISAGSDSLDEIAFYLGLLDAELVVHEPPELRERMTSLGERLIRAARP